MNRVPRQALMRITRRIRRQFRPPVLVLLYHRVADLTSDPWTLAVTPDHFAQHLEILQTHAHPLSVSAFIENLKRGKRLRRAVVVTFDDGYADTLYTAKPLLEEYGVPATVFLPSGLIGQPSEFWWDELDHLLLQPGRLPHKIDLVVDGQDHSWELGDVADYGEEGAKTYRAWQAWKQAPTARHLIYQTLYDLLQRSPEGERKRVINDLRRQIGSSCTARQTHRVMDWDEVQRLAKGPLIDIGAHTISHPRLSSLNHRTQAQEILEDKRQLERRLGRPVATFAYPYGRPGDFTEETVEIVRQAGFRCAFVNFEGTVDHSSDHFRLPRLFVRNMGGDAFKRWLGRWFIS